jgi:cell division protein FtsQ
MSKWNNIKVKAAPMIAGVLLLSALAFVEHQNAVTVIQDVDVRVKGSDDAQFINEQAIRQDLLDRGASLVGAAMPDVDLVGLEDQLKAIPSVKEAVVYHTMDGVLHAEVTQRNAIVRILDPSDNGYYIDQDGWCMPLSSEYTPSVLIVKTDKAEPFVGKGVQHVLASDSMRAISIADEAFSVASVIANDSFWSKMIDHAMVNRDGQFQLVPRVGGQRIIIGEPEKLQGDLAKLKTFYKEGMGQAGWRTYKKIDLRFVDQIVCTKK